MLVVKKAAELTQSQGEWLIENVIPARSLCFLSAPPKLGKTMVGLELSTALASGVPAFGQYRVTKPGRVLYYAGEDSEGGFKKRIDLFSAGKGAKPDQLELYTVTEQSLAIDTDIGQKALVDAIRAVKPELLVLDNLSRLHHSNENNAIAMGLIFEFLQKIKIELGISILLVHHMGKDGTLRGSSQIDSYYEAAIFLKRGKNDLGRFMDFKFRNYEERLGVPYQIRQHDGKMYVVLENEDGGEPDGFDRPTPRELLKQPIREEAKTLEEAVESGELEILPNGAFRRVS